MRSHPALRDVRPVARRARTLAVILAALAGLAGNCSHHEPVGQQTFTSPQVRPIVLSPDGSMLFVANTTSRSVSAIRTADDGLEREIEVGLEPVALAVRPDGSELWVSNHVSDSVSVIDLDDQNATYLHVVETIQEFDANGGTLFDEPTGIAFANDSKAYVALSSRNDIAVVDANTYTVTGRIHITAQEPRAISVQGGHLYVAAFESFNQTELSVCPDGGPGNQCTLGLDDLTDFVTQSPNIPGSDTRIVVDPDVPDRDLFVIDTSTDTVVQSVSGVGTLLYGLVVSGAGEVFLAQTDARNGENALDGENLVELDNRMFLNQIGRVSCPGGSCGAPSAIELEPLPPSQPAPGTQLATPYGLALSDDDAILVGTAAGTSRLFTMDAASGAILDILDLDGGVPADLGQQIPKGVAVLSDGSGAPQRAYVLNSLENTVSVVDVSTPAALGHLTKIPVGKDPTPDAVRRGRIAFNNAFASSTGTFSCESCHPDGNTDQLLWRIGGACFFGECTGDDEIRSTMPVRGLRNTLPLHWDGTLGDPFGGPNGAVGNGGNGGTDCSLGDADGDHDCFLDLVAGSLSGVMCDQAGSCPPGGNELSAQEQDDMATFLAQVQYPPARGRPIDDAVTTEGRQGFSDFFLDRGGFGTFVGVRSCADMDSGCHALPLGADDNSSTLGGFDAPTMRGLLDRTLQFSIGITNAEETLVWAREAHTLVIPGVPFPLDAPPSAIPYDPDDGLEEEVTFAAAFAIFQPVYGQGPLAMLQMFEQADTGFGGALGRQVSLHQGTASGGALAETEDILAALEASDARGFSNLRAVGVRDAGAGPKSIVLSYRAGDDVYRNAKATLSLSRAQLVAEAQAGTLELTFTATLPRNHGRDDYRQPLLSVIGTGDGPLGNPDIPVAAPGPVVLDLAAIDVRGDAQIVLDGQVVSGTIQCTGGSFAPYCDSGEVQIAIDSVPTQGLRLLQVQNPRGPLSVELPICVTSGPFSVCTMP
jgi:YVTN family beta-propeller protein